MSHAANLELRKCLDNSRFGEVACIESILRGTAPFCCIIVPKAIFGPLKEYPHPTRRILRTEEYTLHRIAVLTGDVLSGNSLDFRLECPNKSDSRHC